MVECTQKITPTHKIYHHTVISDRATTLSRSYVIWKTSSLANKSLLTRRSFSCPIELSASPTGSLGLSYIVARNR